MKIILYITTFSLLLILGCSSNKEHIPVGGIYNETKMNSLVDPPNRIPILLRPMIYIADKKADNEMLPGRVLSWSSKIAISSGLLELYVEDAATANLDKRMIKILRILISYTIPSSFAIDINAWNYTNFNITAEEIKGLQGNKDIDSIITFSAKEKIALKYAYTLSCTPVKLNQELLNNLRSVFSEKEIVTIAALTAKVNYWARLIEALRIKPAGYTNDSTLHLLEYNTFIK